MIVSHSREFVFLATPKTGTHAVRFALRPHLAENDEEQVQLFVQRTLSDPGLASIKHGHIGWRAISPVLGPDRWARYFKFAVVRNPWDRFVSYCAFMHRHTGLFAKRPQEAMRKVLANPEHRSRVVFRPQCELLCDDAGVPQVDLVGRYESLQASFDEFCARVGLPATRLERINASNHSDYRAYYDDEIRSRVAEIYATDIAVFGYDFG